VVIMGRFLNLLERHFHTKNRSLGQLLPMSRVTPLGHWQTPCNQKAPPENPLYTKNSIQIMYLDDGQSIREFGTRWG